MNQLDMYLGEPKVKTSLYSYWYENRVKFSYLIPLVRYDNIITVIDKNKILLKLRKYLVSCISESESERLFSHCGLVDDERR